jgi:hypothetical protein
MRLRNKGAIDEFAFVLLAGLIMIVVMLIIWGVPSEVTENVTENVSGIFVVGARPQDVPRSIRIGDFPVSYALGSKVLMENKNIEVKKGMFENKYHKTSVGIEQDMDSVTGAFFVVDVLDTNSGGNLVIKFNDQVIFDQKVQTGEVNVPIDKSYLKSYNIIEISTSSPGWKFWSSSFYYMDRLKFGINYFGNQEKHESFTVYENELQSFKRGEVNLYVENAEGDGDLIIDINGHRVYKGRAIGQLVQPFQIFDVGLVRGVNTISFFTEKGATYEIEDAEVIITHTETGQKTRSVSFNIDSSEYQKLKTKRGAIEFYILDSNYLGSLLVTITDSAGVRHATQTIQSYSIGQLQSVMFDSSYVRVGKNTVTFEASGEGSFVLSNFEVNV